MARNVLHDLNYTFNPTTKTIVLPRYVPQEKLVLITNLTQGTVIYNFSDPNLKATSYSAIQGQDRLSQVAGNYNSGTTTLVLQFNTTAAGMAATDKLQIMIDEDELRFQPHETFIDPANKLRVSTPQSLIDTDFELGLQTTKWEYFQSHNGVQSIYIRPSDTPLSPIYAGAGYSLLNTSVTVSASSFTISGLTLPNAPAVGSYVYIVDAAGTNPFSAVRYAVTAGTTSSVTVAATGVTNGTYTPQIIVFGGVAGNTSNPSYAVFAVTNQLASSGVVAGTPVLITDSVNDVTCDGTFIMAYVNTVTNSFAYLIKSISDYQTNLLRPTTTAYQGGYYGAGYGAGSNLQISSIVSDGARTITVTSITPHGLTQGAPIYVGGTSQANANGPFYVLAVPTTTTFTYGTVGTTSAGTISSTSSVVYVRPEGRVTHRPGDGGVQIEAGNNIIGAQSVRQTRRYFRYQSGKGIQFSTAFTFKPNYDIVGISVSGTIATITTDQDHGLKPGAIVRFTGLAATNNTDTATYNNTFVVVGSQPITSKQFSVILGSTPTDTTPGGSTPTVEVVEAKGYTARAGLFDDQNGMFWEYDGTTINAVRRNSTAILRGTVNVCTGSTLVIGDVNTRFTRQLVQGDRVVIRGATYYITSVVSDTVCYINPPYRAATPSTANGTSGLPYYTVSAATSQTTTINIQTTTTTATISSAASSSGAANYYYMTNTFSRAANTTISSGGSLGSKSIVVLSATSLLPGQLVIGSNLPANTYIDTSYVVGSTTVPLTQAFTGASAGSYDFYTVPSPGVVVTGSSLAGTGTTFVSSIIFTTTGGATTSGTVYVTQPLTAGATGTYVYGAASVGAQVILVASTYGLAPGMVVTGTGVPSNTIVSFIQNQGEGIVLNNPLTTAVGNAVTLTFTTAHNLYANSVTTGGSTTNSGQNLITMTATSSIKIGSFVTSATAGQYIPIGTYVTSINTATNVVTLSQNITLNIPATTTLVFGSRVFVVGSSQFNANGQWPVASITSSTITYQTSAATATTAVISTPGTTKVFAEDPIVRKYLVRETRIPQTQWNLDRFDGTGPSGFNVDPTKMQMIFMDYTWYGAGFNRWGMRSINGDVLYAHKLANNNNGYQAYLRSGNLPGRFELTNTSATYPVITANITSTGYTVTPSAPGTITVFDASKFIIPYTSATGEGKNAAVLIDQEIFFYTGVAATTGTAPWGTVTSVATLGTPTLVNGSITVIPVTSGGAGYTIAPPITFSGGGGGGASAYANIVNGTVVSVTVVNGGTGYTTAPTIVIGANQLTGCVRESNAYTVGALTGTTVTTTGSTAISGVTNAASYFIGQKLAANAAFGYVIPTITAISGTTVYVDQLAVSSGTATGLTPVQISSAATNHYALNNTGIPVSSVQNYIVQLSPAAQHWGVSCIMDGRFDNDKSYVFTTPRSTAAVVNPNTTVPLLSIRVSPSVSLGFARNYGVREIVNRMQLNLYQMDVYTSGQFLITVRYNCNSNVFTPALWTANAVGSGSLSQVIYHNAQDVVAGGDVVLAFYATNAGAGVFASTQQDLTIVKDLGNSVIGGDGVYPDGPDVITVFATNLSTVITNPGSPVFSRLSWTEAQA